MFIVLVAFFSLFLNFYNHNNFKTEVSERMLNYEKANGVNPRARGGRGNWMGRVKPMGSAEEEALNNSRLPLTHPRRQNVNYNMTVPAKFAEFNQDRDLINMIGSSKKLEEQVYGLSATVSADSRQSNSNSVKNNEMTLLKPPTFGHSAKRSIMEEVKPQSTPQFNGAKPDDKSNIKTIKGTVGKINNIVSSEVKNKSQNDIENNDQLYMDNDELVKHGLLNESQVSNKSKSGLKSVQKDDEKANPGMQYVIHS